MRKLLLVTFAVALAAAPLHAQRSATGAEAALLAAMDKTAAAWNAANIAGHAAPYADSAWMMTSRGPIVGREKIRAALERGFWKDGKPQQQLHYENLSVHVVAPDAAYMTGKFVLAGGDQAEKSGWFTLQWRKIDGDWRIVIDHSS